MVATIGIILPSFTPVAGLSPYFDRLLGSTYFNKAIGGVLCSLVDLLLTSTFRFALGITGDLPHLLLAAVRLSLCT